MLLNFLVRAQAWPSLNEVRTPGVTGTGSSLFWWDVREFTLPPESWTCAGGGTNRRIYAKAVLIFLTQDTGDRDIHRRERTLHCVWESAR